jgi:hypothetical protein
MILRMYEIFKGTMRGFEHAEKCWVEPDIPPEENSANPDSRGYAIERK